MKKSTEGGNIHSSIGGLVGGLVLARTRDSKMLGIYNRKIFYKVREEQRERVSCVLGKDPAKKKKGTKKGHHRRKFQREGHLPQG